MGGTCLPGPRGERPDLSRRGSGSPDLWTWNLIEKESAVSRPGGAIALCSASARRPRSECHHGWCHTVPRRPCGCATELVKPAPPMATACRAAQTELATRPLQPALGKAAQRAQRAPRAPAAPFGGRVVRQFLEGVRRVPRTVKPLPPACWPACRPMGPPARAYRARHPAGFPPTCLLPKPPLPLPRIGTGRSCSPLEEIEGEGAGERGAPASLGISRHALPAPA